MNRRLLLLAAVTVAATASVEAAKTGPPAPSFTLRRLGGGRLALRDLRGKTVLLSFWTAG